MDVEFTVQSELSNTNGFALVLLKKEPGFPQEFGSAYGYREDYNGLGIFLYKSQTRFPGKWVSPIVLITPYIVRSSFTKQRHESFYQLRFFNLRIEFLSL